MEPWLKRALDYSDHWLAHQMRTTAQPGCVIAVARQGRILFERAYGFADLDRREALTPRHRFRVASHSKSFTVTALLKLRESGALRIDDAVGDYVEGLHPAVAEATLQQLMSHSAGLVRDGADAGQWLDRRPFPNEKQLRAALAEPPVIEASVRLKYSNHGFGLLGLVIERLTGEPYGDWMRRNILGPARLKETETDGPAPRGAPVARGHSSEQPLGRRVVIPGDNPTLALAPATGFVSTAADLARFFASLDPAAKKSPLTPASRREMAKKQWRDPDSSVVSHYGLGLMMGRASDWRWIGHGGGFQSCLSRTGYLPGRDLAISILTNGMDGPAGNWSDGVIRICQEFSARGAASARTRDWSGRWWSLWGVNDLVAMADHVVVASPGLFNPFADATEIAVTAKDEGTIRTAVGYGNYGEPARLVRDRRGRVREVWLGGSKLVPENRFKAELKRRYGANHAIKKGKA